VLIVLERFGRSIRKPAKTTLVSFAASVVGPGKGFAIQEALDQIGACLGPLLVFLILTFTRAGGETNTTDHYRLCFLVLSISAVLTLVILMVSWRLYPSPQVFEKENDGASGKIRYNTSFWRYIAAISLIGLGFVDFPLISFHLVDKQIFPANIVPLLYAAAMGIDAVSALIFGMLFDRKGISSLMIAIFLSAFFAPLVFLAGNRIVVIAGVLLWGIGMGAQESILKAVITTLVSKDHRATAYGIFNAAFGVFWFVGSAVMGVCYNKSLVMLVIISVAAQLLALPLLRFVRLKNFPASPARAPCTNTRP
jgi:predicted MFS family arabinose efflux permease